MEAGFPVLLIEKGNIQHAAVVHGPHLYQCAAAGDAAGGWVAGQHGPDAGVFAQLLQGLGPRLADALDVPDVGVKIGHGVKSR